MPKKIVATDGINNSSSTVTEANPKYFRAAKFKTMNPTKKYNKPNLDFAQYRQLFRMF